MSVGHYENFPVASRLVPARLRPAVVAIYRFARAADDLADEGDASAPERLAALQGFDEALVEIAAGGTPGHLPSPHWPPRSARTACRSRRCTTSFRPSGRTSPSNAMRRTRTSSSNCRRSANPVGRLVLALYRADGADNLPASDAICTGLQLTNFWQDVAIDWQKDRVYLPLEDLERHGVTVDQIARGQADERWRALMASRRSARGHCCRRAGR